MPSYKVIQSGHILEVYEYQMATIKRVDDEFLSNKGGRKKEGETGKKDRKEEYRATVNNKAFNKLRRLINSNFDENSLFVTLTYADNFQDIKESNYNLKKFVQKMKRLQKDFVYVAVLEFQKRGAIHYHMLCNYRLEWNSHEELQSHERKLGKVWGHGFVDIGYKKNDNAGAYLLKYMTKEHIDERLEGKKRYFFSRGLVQPVELKGADALAAIRQAEQYAPVFTNSYYNDFTGQVQYREYNPKRHYVNLDEEFEKTSLDMWGNFCEFVERDDRDDTYRRIIG